VQWDPSIDEKEGEQEGGTGNAEPSGGTGPGGGAGPSGRADSPDEAGPSSGVGPGRGRAPDTSGDAALANQLALMDSGDEVKKFSLPAQHCLLRG
jgi:hypothetical protein